MTNTTELPSLIAFGSLNVWPSDSELKELGLELTQNEHLAPVRQALAALPGLWEAMVAVEDDLQLLRGDLAAKQLAAWAEHGSTITKVDGAGKHENMFSQPLTIVAHLCRYLKYVKQTGKPHSALLSRAARAGGIQGFCAGLLSALAVASSPEETTIGNHGALSVHLAFAVGAYVDLDSLRNGETGCLALRWRLPSTFAAVQNVVEKHSSSYISVITDANDATVTVALSELADVSDKLRSEGISVLDTGIRGRYHTTAHAGIPQKILLSCKAATNVRFGEQLLVRSNADGKLFTGTHHEVVEAALRDILLERSSWHAVMSEATAHLAEASGGVPLVLAVGADAVPLSVSRALRVIRLPVSPRGKTEPPEASADALYPPDAIVVIGMSCKLPGADSMGEFWQLLTEGKSMVERVPANRWPESSRPGSNNSNNNNNSRSSSGGAVKTYWGNFVRGYDEFDHRFFKKSSREAASMDPQQRLLLQAAYEAMASSGYFTPRPVARPVDVGCYLGLCAVDYDSNVGSHAPNAFSTLGTLRAFLSGKISHFFGWQGPSLTFDTACSSSAVAIHTACRAIQAGECSQALAGGVALFTSPYLFENLSAAHFLSPTGATKPFDARADGYCRGEGLGLVVLKRLSAAVADGDEILAVLGGSAINQNANCVPITVPNAPSQGALYLQVAKLARVQPQDVSLVESHGTGTPVGDPIEMDSIRAVFGGAHRRHPLLVSSVKGNIGHLEGASGVAGLIKAILQIQHRTAVPQASFQSLNPKIPPLGPDRVEIPRRNVPLPHGFLTVCVNNYGAAGSNAAMMVMEPPPPPVPPQARSADTSSTAAEHILPPDSKKPVLITANSAASLLQYCEALRSYCRQLQQQQQRGERANDAQGPQQLFDNIVCHLARRQNHELPFAFTAVAADLPELEAQLSRELSASPQPRPSPRPPLVLAFGGQTRDYAGLSKRLWEQSWPLRRHLDRCHDEVRALGHEAGLYPAVFQSQPITDLVTLHVCLFSIQYATAQAWIDAGLAVSAVIGHSLGQLAALAVSGVLSLSDGLRFVAGRAELMQRHWGPEPGAMIAVEAEAHVIAGLLAEHPLEIACHNGPSSYVLVGDRQCVDNVGRTLGEQGRRYKRLDVTNGFHSKFTEPVIGPLQELASTLHFRKAHIPIETCSDGATWSLPTAHLLARHTREPVFFSQAVQRLAAARGASTWLEAGFDSGVTSMVRRALENPKGHSFQALSLGRADALESVVDATLQLWRQGHGVQFWNVPSPVRGGTPLHLPPYQFEKNQHWLELAPPATLAGKTSPAPGPEQTERVPQLVRLIQHDQSRGIARFEIDPHCEEYQSLVAGHVVAGSPLCPATVYMEIAARACQLLLISSSNATAPLPSRPQFLPLLGFSDVRINAPLGLAVDRRLELTLHQKDRHSAHTWDFTVTGSGTSSQVPTAAAVTHVEGNVFVRNDEAAVETEFARYERLTGLAAVEGLLGDQESELIRGESLYKLFARVVEYGGPYRGLRSAAAKDGRIAGTAVLAAGFESLVESTLTQPPTVDSFMQIAGLHANCIHPCAASDVCVFTQMDHLQFGPGYADSLKTAQPWAVFSNMTRIGSKEIANDIFVFDQSSGRLVVLILGARFHNVRLSSLSKVLSRVNDGDAAGGRNTEVTFSDSLSSRAATAAPSRQPQHEPTTIAAPVIRGRSIVFEEVCNVYEKVAEVPRAKITGTMTADDLGVDSLMMMEVISELSAHFDTHLPIDDLEKLTDVDSLVDYLRSRGCGPRDSDTTASQSPSSSSSSLSSPSDTEASDASSSTTPSGRSSIHLASTPTSNADSSGGIPLQQQKQVDKLASLLQDHLELAAPPKLDANLANLGLDSLLAIELASDIEKFLGVTIDLYQLDETSSFGQLVRLAGIDITNVSAASDTGKVGSVADTPRPQAASDQAPDTTVVSAASHPISDPQNGLQYTSDEGQYSDKNNDLNPTVAEVVELPEPSAVFQELRWGFDTFADQEGFTRFWRSVYPEQARLVLAYAADAFRKLGVDLTKLRAGQPVPELQGVLPKHRHLVARLHHILASGGYVHGQPGARYTRSSMPLRLGDPQELLSTIVARFPRHAAEHRLLDLTGSRLAECLTGQTDPLSLLFASRSNRQLVADVYDLSPMCRAATRLLANYITHAFPPNRLGRVFHFLEVGGGTGGTTKFLVEYLARSGVPFTYTFTDISSALVNAMKKTMAPYERYMRFMALDIDAAPRPELAGQFDAVISTNCIHATQNATTSLRHLHHMLRPDGMLALVEFTQGMYWFDLVYGLLDGWWLFADGRRHALADTAFWDRSLRAAGFCNTSWSDGETQEAQTLRLICGFKSPLSIGLPSSSSPNTDATAILSSRGVKHHEPKATAPAPLSKRAGVPFETVVWKNVDGLDLCADIYYPMEERNKLEAKKRPIALLLHGGGHVVFTRRDIHIKHVKTLLDRGFLPVSVDYRLCPEITMAEGPMTDACDALVWARTKLPHRVLVRPDIVIDRSRLVAVGWSAGGHLAMTLAYGALERNIAPPDAVLAFYCPTNFEDDWWKKPIYPKGIREPPGTSYDLLEGIQDKPISGYRPRTLPGTPMSLQDPRWRIIIHYNWTAQLVPLLVGGLPKGIGAASTAGNAQDWAQLPWPNSEAIRAVSPRAQVELGRYRTPTFIVHGERDDLIPCQQSRDMVDALTSRNIEAVLAAPRDAGHAFDLWTDEDPSGSGWEAVREAFEWISDHVFI